MGKIGFGYGSEWHLLNWLGYHRDELNELVIQAINSPTCNYGDVYSFPNPNPAPKIPPCITWLDFPWNGGASTITDHYISISTNRVVTPAIPGICNITRNNDEQREWQGIEFIHQSNVRAAWSGFWPTTGNSQCWDAVGKRSSGEQDEWILVEAKALERELIGSGCQATDPGRKQIAQALLQTYNCISCTNHATIPSPFDKAWFGSYYQYASRLAVLYFLQLQGISARLVNIYFTKEIHIGWNDCPQSAAGWDMSLDTLYSALGLPSRALQKTGKLMGNVYEVFIPVHR